MTGRRIVVVGATGNMGTALLERLGEADDVDEIVGIARRLPDRMMQPYDVADWVACDVGERGAQAALVSAFEGADAVIHLAWQIQPSHDLERLWRTNVLGTRTVVESAVAAGVGHVVYASSVGTYAPGPKDRAVDETWAHTGVATSSYSRHKATVEDWLDLYEPRHPEIVVTRLRPGLIFQGRAGSEITRYFLGPLVPTRLARRVPLPFVPLSRRLIFQAVHADDVAEAYLLAVRARLGGAFNIAAEPVLSSDDIARAIRARSVLPVPLGLLRGAAAASWHLRLQPTSPGWIDLAGAAPVMNTSRARKELGWEPRITAVEALDELVTGMSEAAGSSSPPMRPGTGGAAT